MRAVFWGVSAVVVAVFLALVPHVHGQATSAAAPRMAYSAAVRALESESTDEVYEALSSLGAHGRPQAAPAIAALLLEGQPDAITDRALEVLGTLRQPSSIDVVVRFTKHRRRSARARAYRTLGAIGTARVHSLVAAGLRDSEAEVRAAAAVALGQLGARDVLPDLFRAFERGVPEAAVAIGKVGEEASIERYSRHLGAKPLAVLLPGYEQFLMRNDISVAAKRALVTRLGEVSGLAIRDFLERYLARLPERDATGLREHVTRTLRRIPTREEEANPPRPAATSPTGNPR